MKIYFAGSIKGGRQDVDLYAQIISHLKTKGDVLTEHIADPNISHKGETNKNPNFIHDRDLKWLEEADAFVGELTTPSLGVGYEVGRASNMGKKMLVLFRNDPDRLSNMIKGCPGVEVQYYKTLNEAKKIIDNYFVKL